MAKNNNNDNNKFEAGQSNAGAFENENFLHFLGWSAN